MQSLLHLYSAYAQGQALVHTNSRRDLLGRCTASDLILVERGPCLPSSESPELALVRDLQGADVAWDHSAEDEQIPGDLELTILQGMLHTGVLIATLAEVAGACLDILTVLKKLVDPVDVATDQGPSPGVLQALILQVVDNVGHICVQSPLFVRAEAVHRRDVSGIVAPRVDGVEVDIC